MRKLTALLFAVALVFGTATLATAQNTYTWSLIEGAAALELWPNEANAPNIFEANGGLLGRVNTEATVAPGGDMFAASAGSCQLAPSTPCIAGSPPAFLLPVGSAEPGAPPVDSECNRQVIACNTIPVDNPFAAHGGHIASPPGEYSYMVIHTKAGATEPGGKGISFFSGSYTAVQQPYVCNDCPPTGHGKDIPNQIALDNSGNGSITNSTNVNLWITQSSAPFGHANITLTTGGSGPGKLSVCGNGVVFQTLDVDLCINGTAIGGDFQLLDQKVVIETYSVDTANHASTANPGICNPPDCYVENVIIPAAAAQAPGACGAGGACNVQRQLATTILPATAPEKLIDATVDTLIYALTTSLLDMDGDGVEDRNDPCPNDATDFCRLDLIGGGSCPAGTVFCLVAGGGAGCQVGALCDTRLDVDQTCDLRAPDPTAILTSIGFNSVAIGPFDP
jgi:hypothetical protein